METGKSALQNLKNTTFQRSKIELIQQFVKKRGEESSSFFSILNLNFPGLEKVKESAKNGNFNQASEYFLEHMRKRSTPVFYEGWSDRVIDKAYDTAEADKICQRHIVHQDVGDDIDWQKNLEDDMEWVYCINRHEFLTTLGRAYWHTGDEKYTRSFKDYVTDWIDKNPCPDIDWMLKIDKEQSRAHFMKEGNWRPIEAGIRLYTAWLPCLYHFINSPEFTSEFLIKMSSSMVDHARFLRRYYTRHVNYFNVSPNWGLMESNGLAHMGILFPEFKEAEDWKNTALSRFEEQVRMQILPDGVHIERCSGYHLVCTFCILQIAELALRNGQRVSEIWLGNLEKMIDYVLYLMKPHGVYPMLSDGDESDVIGERASYGLWEDINNLNMLEDPNDLRYVLKAGARLFNRPDMLYVATQSKEGKMPEKKSAAFPDGGFYVTRSGWEKEDKYMVINCGPMGAHDQKCVHGHSDALSIDVSAFGKTMIIDPGRYMYEGPYREWFEKSAAHNTVTVDGKDQSEMLDGWLFKTMAVPTKKHWVTSDNFDYFDGSHDGYERLDSPVTHRRRVLFVKSNYWIILDDMSGKGEHDYDLYFHLPEEAKVKVDNVRLNASVDYGNNITLNIIPCGTLGLSSRVEEGWVSYDYGVKMPAPILRYSQKTEGPARFTTILCPLESPRQKITSKWIAKDILEVTKNGSKDIVIFSDGSETKYGDFEFDGQVLYAGLDSKGTLKNCFSVGSSFISHCNDAILDSRCNVKQNGFEQAF